MDGSKTWVFGLVIGVLAVILGGTLLYTGRAGGEPASARFQPETFDGDAVLRLTETLSSDALEGRATGTKGAEAARGFIQKRFETLGVKPIGDSYQIPFTITPPAKGRIIKQQEPVSGINVVGWIAGETPGQGPVLVLTAHYDHLGVQDGQVYNGADDNASGVAALTAIAQHFQSTPPKHDIILAALDAEEKGLLGAHAFVQDPPVPLTRIALNFNFDMISRSHAGELYVAGLYHSPELRTMFDAFADNAPVTLLTGHDEPEDGVNDWTGQSDHAVFHEAGVPFLYFGVEDHAGYHKPGDDFENITHDFFLRSVATLVNAAEIADERLEPRAN